VWRREKEAGKRSTVWWRKKRGDAREQIRQREKKNREERELELPKDLSTKSENCRDLFVKKIFPLI
jgi:hypothetical protein